MSLVAGRALVLEGIDNDPIDADVTLGVPAALTIPSPGSTSRFYSPPRKHLFEPNGFLTSPSTEAPLDIAVDYLTGHAAELGLAAADLANFVVTSQYVSEHTGATHIYLGQTHGGLEVVGGNINLNVSATGEVINVGNSFVAGLGTPDGGLKPGARVGASDALRSLATKFGWKLTAAPAVTHLAGGPGQTTVLAARGVSAKDIPAELVFVPTADGGVELAWNLLVETVDGNHAYDASVSASDGEVLRCSDWVSADTYNVYELPSESPNFGSRTLVANPASASASPYGWHDTNGVAGAEYSITRGNNVHAYADRNDDGIADPGSEADGGAGLAFDFPVDLAQEPLSYQEAAVAQLFYSTNVIHDIYYRYGFDEAAGNFQLNNYGKGGLAGDNLLAEVQNGAGLNPPMRRNANFLAPPDGERPHLQMYVWDMSLPMRDGALDTGIVVHEYTHGLSARLSGGPGNPNALSAMQSGAMAEGWSDWYSLMLTQEPTDKANDARGLGTYVLGQPPDGPGVRTKPCSYNMAINPYTYADIISAMSPHDAGEVWAATLWDLNWALIDGNTLDLNLPKPGLGFNPGLYSGTGGNTLALQLVTDALKLQPAFPSYLDARDAILLADQTLTGGANQMTIWTVFARRGMGQSANDGGSADTLNVTEAFDLPVIRAGVVTFDAAAYEVGQAVTIQVRDGDLAGSSPFTVEVSSTGGDSETVWLSASTNGTFTGSIVTGATPFTASNGTLEVAVGDVITVTYYDTDDGSGNSAVVTDTADIITLPLLTQIYSANMDTDPGWTLDPGAVPAATFQWEWGTPTGGGGQFGGNPDPSAGHTGSNVVGYNLSGNYPGNLAPTQWATTPPINASAYSDVQLEFYRWLNVDLPTMGHAYVEVSNDGSNWNRIWENTSWLADSSWELQTFDISSTADQQATVFIRWGMGATNDPWPGSGWNIDDVVITGSAISADIDFGDAPAPYPTLLADGGARHVASGPRLGTNRDAEPDGQANAAADGDDTAGTPNDEDGVLPGSAIRVGQLDAAVTVDVQNAPSGAKLDAWIDFNGDGSWGGPGEQIADGMFVWQGYNFVQFDVPGWANEGTTYARFRLSSAGDLGPGGAASDGEVEDYQVTILPPAAAVGVFVSQPPLTTSADGAESVFAADMDGDGDMDVLSASSSDDMIAWYENRGAGNFTAHAITTATNGAASVFAADVDGDGDMDVLSASWADDKIAWYENDGAENFSAHTITTAADSVRSVFVADVDNDGDMDVLSASDDHAIAWYENDGSEAFIARPISTLGAYDVSVFAADMDGDGDMDVLSTSHIADTITWHENNGDENFTAHSITSSAAGIWSVFAADMDGDGDMDVLSASARDDTIAWYENDGTENFTAHTITASADGALSVFAADLDGDGDMDVLSASYYDDTIAWYENNGAESFVAHSITTSANGATSVFAADMDGDGDMDVLSASMDNDTIAWYENVSAPSVVGVFFRGGTWRTAFLDFLDSQGHGHATIPHLGFANPVGGGSQLDVMPWVNVDQVSIVFNIPTVVEADDLAVFGANTASYALNVAGFSYDAATFTATWTLAEPLPVDKLLLRLDSDSTAGVRSPGGEALDGEWTNPADPSSATGDTFPSGNGTPGGDFTFRVNVNPGNVNRDGGVNFVDFFDTRFRVGQTPGGPSYTIRHDVDGNGGINFVDAFECRSCVGQVLPSADPFVPLNVLRVDDDSAAGEPDGLSWGSAFSTLEAALARARTANADQNSSNDVTEIRIAAGTYRPTALSDADGDGTIDTDPRSATFLLPDGVATYGGFAGVGSTDPNARDINAHPTVLSGDLGTAGDKSDNAYTVVTVLNLTQDTTLDGVTVTAGNADGVSGLSRVPSRSGGGVHLSDANPSNGLLSLANMLIAGNSGFRGGGVSCFDGAVMLTNSTLSGNSNSYEGGGIYISDGTVTVRNSTLSGNSSGVKGGGIFISSGTLAVTNSIVCLNDRDDIEILAGDINVSNCLISVDPGFVRDPSAGPDGVWGTADDDLGDLRLTARSAAVNAGSNTAALDANGNPLIIDLAGSPRVADGTVDIGAHEYQGPPATGRETPSTVVSVADDVFDLYDGRLTLREAIYYASQGVGQGTITFQTALDGAVVTLAGTELLIYDPVEIDASALSSFTVDAADLSRVFHLINDATLSALTISGGSAYSGGAISSTVGTVTITNSTISDSLASYEGGGIYSSGNTVNVTNSTLWSNSAYSKGGGIYSSDGTVTVTNSTLSGNSKSNRGGGIYSSYSTVTVTNSTLSGNSAYDQGNGICGASSTLVLRNSIVSLNDGDDIEILAGDMDVSSCLISVDPGFVRDPSAGPDGTWGTDDDDLGDLRLTDRSVAINAGNNAAALDVNGNPLTIDLAGSPRVADGTVDIGAHEYQGPPATGRETPSAVVSVADDVFDLYDGRITLREALYYSEQGVGNGTVTFQAGLDGATITLAGAELFVNHPVVIDASALLSLTVDADHRSRVFQITDDATLTGLTIVGGTTYRGGGIRNFGTLALTDSTLSGNSATGTSLGGGICNSGTLTLMNSTLAGNSAAYGGGVYSSFGTVTVTNSTLSGNLAQLYGGGIHGSHSTIRVTNSTLAGNSVTGTGSRGGGIYAYYGGTTLNNTIVAFNTAPSNPDVWGTIAGSHNLIRDGSGMTGISNGTDGNLVGVDPLFVRNPSDGGDGWGDNSATPAVDESANDDYGDLRLQSGSPARDSGSNLYLDEVDSDGTGPDLAIDLDGSGTIGDFTITTDRDGNPRIENTTVDMGAYEFRAAPPPAAMLVAHPIAPESQAILLSVSDTVEQSVPMLEPQRQPAPVSRSVDSSLGFAFARLSSQKLESLEPIAPRPRVLSAVRLWQENADDAIYRPHASSARIHARVLEQLHGRTHGPGDLAPLVGPSKTASVGEIEAGRSPGWSTLIDKILNDSKPGDFLDKAYVDE